MNSNPANGTMEPALSPTNDDYWNLDGFFGRRGVAYGRHLARAAPWGCVPASNRTDIIDRGDAYEVVTELPGVPKEKVSVRLKGQELTIHAETPVPEAEKDGQFVMRERHQVVYDRTFELTEPVAASAIQAKLDAGVLTVRIPKPKPIPEETIPIVGAA